jgi:hypothetical protein
MEFVVFGELALIRMRGVLNSLRRLGEKTMGTLNTRKFGILQVT